MDTFSKRGHQENSTPCELTVLMPCLNEAETLAICIGKANDSLKNLGIDGEVLIADNGSTDGSQEIANSPWGRAWFRWNGRDTATH